MPFSLSTCRFLHLAQSRASDRPFSETISSGSACVLLHVQAPKVSLAAAPGTVVPVSPRRPIASGGPLPLLLRLGKGQGALHSGAESPGRGLGLRARPPARQPQPPRSAAPGVRVAAAALPAPPPRALAQARPAAARPAPPNPAPPLPAPPPPADSARPGWPLAPPWRRPTSGGPARPRPARRGLAAPGAAVLEVRPLFPQCPPAAPLSAALAAARCSSAGSFFTRLSRPLPSSQALSKLCPRPSERPPAGPALSASLGFAWVSGLALLFPSVQKAFPGPCYFHDTHTPFVKSRFLNLFK